MSKITHLLALNTADIANIYCALQMSQELCCSQIEECEEEQDLIGMASACKALESLSSTMEKIEPRMKDLVKIEAKTKNTEYNPRREY